MAAGLVFPGCGSIQSVDPTDVGAVARKVWVGDDLSCELRDGTRRSFRVSDVRPPWITGFINGNQAASLYLPDAVRIVVRRGVAGAEYEEAIFICILSGGR